MKKSSSTLQHKDKKAAPKEFSWAVSAKRQRSNKTKTPTGCSSCK